MDKKTFARTSQAVTVRCKQMVDSGQNFCASILPELNGDYEATKKCESLLNSSRTGHIAKMLVSTKFKKVSEAEAKEEENPTATPYVPDPLVVVTYVPDILGAKLSAQDWHSAVIKDLTEIKTESNGTFVYGIYHHPEPFKGQDELVCKSFAFLKTQNLYVEPPDSDDEPDELWEFRNQII
jgi:hypothetical protein